MSEPEVQFPGAPEGHIHDCEGYLRQRTGKYEWRAVRYRAAARQMVGRLLGDDDLVVDVGAGWTELDYLLRREFNWRGRYFPVDGMFDGTDLERWVPPRTAEFFVCLEILEHLQRPERLVRHMKAKATRAIVVSVPNPRTTDVLGMDPTHKTIVTGAFLHDHGFSVEECAFYGSEADSLLAVWERP